MVQKTFIGDDRREAIDWLQDWLVTTRPIAERTMISLLKDGIAVTTDGGIMLTEDDDDVKKKSRYRAQSSGKGINRKSGKSFKSGSKQRSTAPATWNRTTANEKLLAEADIILPEKEDDPDALP